MNRLFGKSKPKEEVIEKKEEIAVEEKVEEKPKLELTDI